MRSTRMRLHIGASRLHRWLALVIGVAASRAWNWPIDFNPSVFGASALIGLLCGLVFGAIPARRAADAPPAGAVRA